MNKIRKFKHVDEVLTANEIVTANTIDDIISGDYTKAYALGLSIENLIKNKVFKSSVVNDFSSKYDKYVYSDLGQDIFQEYKMCVRDCEDSGINDPEIIYEHIITTMEKVFSKDIALWCAFLLGVANAGD